MLRIPQEANMKRCPIWLLGLTLVLTPAHTIRAGDPAEPQALIDRALAAGGGVEKIGSFRALVGKGDVEKDGEKMPVAASFQKPGQIQVRMGKDGALMNFVFNHDKAWIKASDSPTEEMPESDSNSLKNFFHALSLPDRLIDLKDSQYSLATADSTRSNGDETACIKVTHKDYKDVLLYFNKATGLPAKSRVLLPGNEGKETWCDFIYSDYKAIQGVKHFMHLEVWHDDSKVMDIKIKELKLLDELDSSTFAKPSDK
jgi:hypothetical protein